LRYNLCNVFKFIKAIIPEHAKAIVEDPGLNTPVKIASYLYDQGYRAVTFVAGSDRLERCGVMCGDSVNLIQAQNTEIDYKE
jgi:hypothetical protein